MDYGPVIPNGKIRGQTAEFRTDILVQLFYVFLFKNVLSNVWTPPYSSVILFYTMFMDEMGFITGLQGVLT